MTRIVNILILSLIAVTIIAAPARHGGVVKTQPDGTTITIYMHGDEHFHYLTTEDGTWVAKDETGFYKPIQALSQEEVAKRHAASPRRAKAQTNQASPINIAPRGLIILVNFKDVKMATENDNTAFNDMLNGADYSVRKYFQDQSYGQYNPQFDVVGPVELPENMAYYGGNDSNGDDKGLDSLLVQACRAADPLADYSLYDNNNDGQVDFIYFIYAGFSEADSYEENTIWPHSWELYGGMRVRLTLDGKQINKYACGAELNYTSKKRDGIGTFCHEFSHVLGLTDLYPTNGSAHKTHGEWDIMDYGNYNNNGNTPPSYSAYERFFLGWLTPTILNEAQTRSLSDIQAGPNACIITADGTHNLVGNDPQSTLYYVLENRQQTGWDEYLPGHGMLITRVDYKYNYWGQNIVTADYTKILVDIIEADGETPIKTVDQYGYVVNNGWHGKSGDAFPTGADNYTPFTNYPITNITEENGIITFDFMGGGNLTANEMIPAEETILAIYNILGQLQSTTTLHDLSRGAYIIKTNINTHKIIIP